MRTYYQLGDESHLRVRHSRVFGHNQFHCLCYQQIMFKLVISTAAARFDQQKFEWLRGFPREG
ncbi:hypothetical protein FRX31_006372 [Thalictrum thalictroides]|uniref:Uncharacterized protein n=1 Tax=Thalictrum thalictroides TaxID=46969 RepID=A0A7J6X647_THATH|nr:hypothetical protein FRX31_006372 [Thalictrum thalictroides]